MFRVQARDPPVSTNMGVSEKKGVPYFGVLIIRILLIWGTILGTLIFGNPHIGASIIRIGFWGVPLKGS